MLIPQDSTIRLFKGVPLDSDYKNTIWFSTLTKQISFFNTKLVMNINKGSYQRVSLGYIKVNVPYNQIYSCNYLAFMNADGSSTGYSRWFYAFITNMEYINNTTTGVWYTIDVLQTWMFDYTFGKCMVEREHIANDIPGANILPENVALGDLVDGGLLSPFYEGLYQMSDLSLVLVYDNTLFDLAGMFPDSIRRTPGFYGGVFQGFNFVVLPASPGRAYELEQLVGTSQFLTSGALITAFLYPTMLIPTSDADSSEVAGKYKNKSVYVQVPKASTIAGYGIPKNKKLLTYPYTFVSLVNNDGSHNDYAYEFFDDASGGEMCGFALSGALSVTPSVMAYPVQYKGVLQYLEGAVTIHQYPTCNFNFDNLIDWLTTNGLETLIGVVTAIAAAPVAPAVSAAAGSSAVGSALAPSGGANAIGPGTQLAVPQYPNLPLFAKDKPPEPDYTPNPIYLDDYLGLMPETNTAGWARGINVSASQTPLLFGIDSGRVIEVRAKGITAQRAKIIDDYFSMYGYSTKELKYPGIFNRSVWNYVRTKGCVVFGDIPVSAKETIRRIFDSGITIWHDPNNVGNYDLDNPPNPG